MKINLLKHEKNRKTICHSSLDGASKKQSSELFFVRKAMRHNESKWGTQDELMSELKSILPLKNKGSQRGFAQNPSCHFPYVLREGQIGRSTPIFHPWTSVSKIPAFAGMTEQVGRSMVEMLGTLAVMGVIGMAGLSAFNHAMNSLKANTILHEVNKRAHTCVPQLLLMNKTECSLSEYPDKIEDKYLVSTKKHNNNNNAFEIRIADIPQEICQQIKNKGLIMAGKIEPETCANLNQMVFAFNTDLNGKECREDSDCTVCGHCVEGVCTQACEIPEPDDEKNCGENECVVYDEKLKTCEYQCTQKEWLESTAPGQWIDSGIKAYNAVVKAELSFANPNGYIFGAGSLGVRGWGVAFGVRSNKWSAILPGKSYNTFGTATENQVNFTWVIDGDTSTITGYDSNTATSPDHFGEEAQWRSSDSFRLFNSVSARFYFAKIYLDDKLVRDFVPVLAPDGQTCLFDKVSQKLFRGTGGFKTN